jgi:hypothetical protein
MKARHLGLAAVALLAWGCSSPGGAPGAAGSAATASFKGAKVRVLNLSPGVIEASLNDQTFGNPVPVDGTTIFKLTAFKKPGKVNVGPHEFSVPLKGSTAFTVVYTGNDKPTIITGEPTEIAGGMSVVYFYSFVDGGTGQKVSVKTGSGDGSDVAFAESKVVSPGSYRATVTLANGKEASANVDLEAGNAVTLMLAGTSSEPRLIVLVNDTRMLIGGSSGFSPTG